MKYSWLPQAMVKDAAISVYDDIRKEEGKGMREGKNFRKATKNKPALPDRQFAEAMALKKAKELALVSNS